MVVYQSLVDKFTRTSQIIVIVEENVQCSSMKFCSYNFVLNEAPNTNDVTRAENMALNEVSNSVDATCVANNVC